MESNYLYYNLADALHTERLKETIYDNSMSEEQAVGVEDFLHSLKTGSPLIGTLPVRLVCIQGDAGTGKTQAVVSLCQMLNCPIIVGSTNSCSVNVAQRCRSSFPYSSCIQAQLGGTVWAGMNWNVGSEIIGRKWEAEIAKIYMECVRAKAPPSVEQDMEIYNLLNKMLFPKMREKFELACEATPQKQIYATWESARTGGICTSTKTATRELYDMFCSIPREQITQEDFNAALAFRCLTAFSEQLPRPLLSNFLLIEESARLAAYFIRISSYYHYMVRFHLKPPGYRTSMLTICFMGSPLQSSVICFPDFSVMDEAVLDVDKRHTHISIYTVNRRTPTDSIKGKALASVVHVLENDCPLQQEHCRLLDPFVVPQKYFMDPTFAPSAIRLTHYHKTAVAFTDKANSMKNEVITFYEHIFISEGVKAKQGMGHNNIIEFLVKKGAACLPYRNTKAKDIKAEDVAEISPPIVVRLPTELVNYRIFSIKRVLGKNTPVIMQHTTRLTPVQFNGTYHAFYNAAALSDTCNEQLWSLRIGLSFASILLRSMRDDQSYSLAIAIDDVWYQLCLCAKDIFMCGFDDVEQRTAIAASLTESHDYLWRAVIQEDSVRFVYTVQTVVPFYGEERRSFPDTILIGNKFHSMLTLEGAVELTPPDILGKGYRMKGPHQTYYKSQLCMGIIKTLVHNISCDMLHLHDLLLRAHNGVLFRTVNTLVPDQWFSVFPRRHFQWESVAETVADEEGCGEVPESKKLKQHSEAPTPTSTMNEGASDIESNYLSDSQQGWENARGQGNQGCEVEEEEEEEGELSPEEANSIIHMLHTVYDSRVRTIDSVQGDTIACSTLVDVQSIKTMGQLTVALTRNTDPDKLMLTSSDITHIPKRDPITKFVRLSARDTPCYYVK